MIFQMVNLESSSFGLGDFSSVLHEIFLPNSTSSVDPKLVLRSGGFLPPYSSPSPGRNHVTYSSPGRDHVTYSSPGRDQVSYSSPGRDHVTCSSPSSSPVRQVSTYTSLNSPGGGEETPSPSEELSKDEVRPPSPSHRVSSPIDIVNLASQEIRRPSSRREEKGRVAWNLAGLVSHLQPEPALPHPYSGYAHPAHSVGYAPNLHHLPPEVSSAGSSYNFAAAMGVTAPPGLAPLSLSSSNESPSSNPPAPNPPYKMEPMDTSMYYHGGVPEPGEHHNGGPPSFQAPLEHTDVMQTLHQYLQPSVDMPHEPMPEGAWLDHTGLHPGLFPHQEYDYRSYTDRKKKIIREWNKNNSSPRPPETLSAAGDPLRHPYMGPEFLHNSYAPYGVKDEPLRTDYYSAYAAYGAEGLVNPYVHMGRREKRKKHDSLPGGNSLTRDERKAQALGLPITCSDIINLPMDEFNDLLSKHELTEEQLTLCRDIRRRGKNKVAAQNCRKRKIDQIKQLETEVTRIKCRKTEIMTDHDKLMQQRATWTDLVKRLHDYVLKELGHDPNHWQLNIDHSRQVHILPRGHIDPSRGTQPLIDPSSRIQQSHHDPSRGLDHRAHLMDQGRGQGHGHGQGLLDHEVHQHEHELGVNMRQDQDKVRAFNMGLRGNHGPISHPVPVHPIHPS
ncbi:uncharacterized protein LOC111700473 isoform X3 [Eurytemora carolleeae]|uniref:uncharacterized protein LOC111700473 isoform X3 n=1 Tax=Eurytemora carolleeae TaxID=1294199 RepID=UPI000C787D4A|nr:uncharacterized protein LOC111700473 isoform X3 [Eurytemora carolleeae]|eukprot:XP_023327161.1 uncharacterized protein LOC111700473 isoform X3 [Eurytemora affinis]